MIIPFEMEVSHLVYEASRKCKLKLHSFIYKQVNEKDQAMFETVYSKTRGLSEEQTWHRQTVQGQIVDMNLLETIQERPNILIYKNE
jgi:S-adenosylmethionine:tRNA-ribosyltransferase-isomerase (queuine synthetase)